MATIEVRTEASNSLLRYLERKGRGPTGAINLIENMDLGPLVKNHKLNFSKVYESKLNKKLELQKTKYKIFENELLLLTENFQKNQIKLIHIKGWFLGLDLYSPVETRISGDIDLLIDVNQLEDILDLLGNLGYSVAYTGEIVNKSFINDDLTNHSRLHSHIPVLEKRVTTESGDEFLIEMDLHTRLFNNVESEWYKMQAVLDRAIHTKYDKQHFVWLLEHHDRLMHLMYHFSKEYTVDTLLYGDNNPKIKLLHDIALFIDKYGPQINWKYLLETTNDLKVEFRILLTSVLVDEIYPNRVPKTFIAALRDHFKLNYQLYKGSAEQIEKAVNFSAETILFGDSQDFYKDFVTILGLKSEVLECQKKDSIAQLDEVSIRLTENEYPVANQFGSYVVFEKNLSKLPLQATCNLGWNSSSFLVKIDVTDHIVASLTDDNAYLGGISIGLGPGSSDHTSDRKSYIKQFYFNPKVDGGLRYWNLKLDDEKDNQNLSGEGQYPYIYNLTTNDSGYLLGLEIPWSSFGIVPASNLCLAFDIKVNFYDFEGKPKKQMAWSNHYDNIWHPEYMGILRIVD
ncbi:nucleotidyltransferase family protein [Paenibacillus sp. JNUCC31]|uniref:nucleotidyltransferase family protein n=1 Tax=Paenibacillus sp. JNUCC-31 TaxID=2777983 RepID=UPI00177B6E13|nr:nucleotidyltransferase family protein [Paenibacillus sp. JNUCC-31]QOS76721.1 nucleotidyltransferase family protein [Paenibacillus sp. JNUCC-31]